MDGFETKRIADPVHGTMGFSELELEIIHSKAFQRLRNIKQLGLAYLVFPGADHSRFSHSLGVCHVTGMILDSLKKHADIQLTFRDLQEYRLAGLLHDIGHYPFSHAMEDAIKNYVAENFMGESLEHESVSEAVLTHDSEIGALIDGAGYSVSKICSIFSSERQGTVLPAYSNVVSSEIDADRIDYMLRTAHQSGLPYGSVDLLYLLSQFRLDSMNRICLTNKAVRTAEHFLLCRYFDYQQISYHKAVASLEWALQEVLTELLRAESIHGTKERIIESIKNGHWCQFDDPFIINKIREHRNSATSGPSVTALCDVVLKRNPPKLMAEIESVEAYGKGPGDEVLKRYNEYAKKIKERLHVWANDSGIDSRLWYVRGPKAKTITKTGPSGVWGQPEEREQSIKILRSDSREPVALVDYAPSLLSVLSRYALYSIRIYVVMAHGINESAVGILRRRILDDLPGVPWK